MNTSMESRKDALRRQAVGKGIDAAKCDQLVQLFGIGIAETIIQHHAPSKAAKQGVGYKSAEDMKAERDRAFWGPMQSSKTKTTDNSYSFWGLKQP